jgi:protein TonB
MVLDLEYPAKSLKAGEQGNVRFRVDVTSRGKPENCVILESSGFPNLDKATCESVVDGLRFTPATDANGKRVRGTYTRLVRWIIPGAFACEHPYPAC